MGAEVVAVAVEAEQPQAEDGVARPQAAADQGAKGTINIIAGTAAFGDIQFMVYDKHYDQVMSQG